MHTHRLQRKQSAASSRRRTNPTCG